MKISFKILTLILLNTLMLNLGISQSNIDCLSALKVNVKDTINFQGELPTQGLEDENITDFCGTNILDIPGYLETNAYWYHYRFSCSGNFTFTITPNDLMEDVDFMVFKSKSSDCSELTTIRCMFSGENIGGPIDTKCLGGTGLNLNSTDIFEDAGCNFDSDNFLAPVDAEEGDNIYLAIMSYSNEASYTISHGGTACLIGNSVNTTDLEKIKTKIYPNPSSELIKIEASQHLISNLDVEIYDMHGKKMPIAKSRRLDEINISNLNTGIYMIKLVNTENREIISLKKLIKK